MGSGATLQWKFQTAAEKRNYGVSLKALYVAFRSRFAITRLSPEIDFWYE